MNSDVSLTLIICTYCRPDQIGCLLEAIEGQARIPDEILVVDGSPDANTANVIRGLPIVNVTYYRVSAQDRGLTRQRNYGIARASGDIIAFLDDDTVPDPTYFQDILDCFARHPDAVGVGGYIDDVPWQHCRDDRETSLATFRFGEWQRREDYRWRLRKMLGLAGSSPPGQMPAMGHGRSLGFFPPDGQDHVVEFVMGGASAWRRHSLERHTFSRYFEGYGLYEDLEYSIRAGRDGPLVLCTRARLAHHHAPSGRPNQFHYGVMVARNGWFVWRRRWPHPPVLDRIRWWAITVLLSACRFGDALRGPQRMQALSEAFGRLWGTCTLVWSRPKERHGP